MNRRVSLALSLCLIGLLWQTVGMAAPDPVEAGYAAFEQKRWHEAYEYWVPEADRGDPQAQFYLSQLFRDGLGTEASEETALTLLMLSAEGGYAPAAYRLGLHYHSGDLIAQDRERALYWWRQAAEQGNEEAQLRLAALYYLGWMVQEDPAQAFDWYQRAAANGSRRAKSILARLGLTDPARDPADPGRYRATADTRQLSISRTALRTAAGDVAVRHDNRSDSVVPAPPQQSYRLQDKPLTLADAAVKDQLLLSPTAMSPPAGERGEVSDRLQDLAWIERQPEENFTLQLFSSDKRESAERVARTLKSPWRVTIFPFDRFGYRWFGVLAGSFDSRQKVVEAKQQLVKTNRIDTPWIRRFQNVRKRD